MDHAGKWLRMKDRRRISSVPAVSSDPAPAQASLNEPAPAGHIPGAIEPPPSSCLMDLRAEWQAGQEAPKARPYLRLADEDSAPPLTLEQLDSKATRCTLRLLTAAKGRWRLTHDKETGAPVPSPAQPILYLSDDRMAAWIMVFPPVAGGAPAEIQDVRDAMDAYLVSSGIDETAAARIVEQQIYFRLVLVACGTLPGKSTDGSVEELFPRQPNTPNDEDMLVASMLNPSYIAKLEKGTPICRRIPARRGRPGRTVLGAEMEAPPAQEALLSAGKNTAFSGSDVLESSTEGYLYFESGHFHVQQTLTVPDGLDEDSDTIDFDGDVWIGGDVFCLNVIRATGSVVVKGSVENSFIQAGKNVIIFSGVVGEDEATIRAGACVFAKYLEHCIVYAGRSIVCECSICSHLYSDDHISILKGRGVTVGGSLTAARLIEASIIGSQSERSTQIVLGEHPCSRDDCRELEQRLQDIAAEAAEAEKAITANEWIEDESSKLIAQAKERLRLTKLRLKEQQLRKRLDAIKSESVDLSGCELRGGTIYPKTSITIGPGSFCVPEILSSCTFKLVGTNIRAFANHMARRSAAERDDAV